MASNNGLLSDLQLKKWIRAGVPLKASDGGGLIFVLSSAGHAAWVLRYRHGNQRPELTLGPYPAIGLSANGLPDSSAEVRASFGLSVNDDITTVRPEPSTLR